MARGDSLLVQLPFQGTHEQAGTRPAVDVGNDALSGRIPMRLVVPITSKPSALRIPLSVILQPTALNQLTTESYALVVHLRALDPTRIVRPIGKLDPLDMASVEAAIRTLPSLK